MSESKSTSPHGYSTAECNIDALNAIRKDFKKIGIKISLNDLVIKAAATALQLVPEVNINTLGEDDYQAELPDDTWLFYSQILAIFGIKWR